MQVVQVVQAQVGGVSELAANGQVSEDRVHVLGIDGYGGGLEVLDELAQAHGLADGAEGLLGGLEGGDGGLRVVGAV